MLTMTGGTDASPSRWDGIPENEEELDRLLGQGGVYNNFGPGGNDWSVLRPHGQKDYVIWARDPSVVPQWAKDKYRMATAQETANMQDPNGPGNGEGGSDLSNILKGAGFIAGGAGLLNAAAVAGGSPAAAVAGGIGGVGGSGLTVAEMAALEAAAAGEIATGAVGIGAPASGGAMLSPAGTIAAAAGTAAAGTAAGGTAAGTAAGTTAATVAGVVKTAATIVAGAETLAKILGITEETASGLIKSIPGILGWAQANQQSQDLKDLAEKVRAEEQTRYKAQVEENQRRYNTSQTTAAEATQRAIEAEALNRKNAEEATQRAIAADAYNKANADAATQRKIEAETLNRTEAAAATQRAIDARGQAWGVVAPSQGRYEGSFQPGFTMANDPGFMDALNQSSKATLHGLSMNGNPAGSPNAWAQSLKDNYEKVAYPALKDYRTTNYNSGYTGEFARTAANPVGVTRAATGVDSQEKFTPAGVTRAASGAGPNYGNVQMFDSGSPGAGASIFGQSIDKSGQAGANLGGAWKDVFSKYDPNTPISEILKNFGSIFTTVNGKGPG